MEYSVRLSQNPRLITNDTKVIELPLITLPGDVPIAIEVTFRAETKTLVIDIRYPERESKTDAERMNKMEVRVGRKTGRPYQFIINGYNAGGNYNNDWSQVRKALKLKFGRDTRKNHNLDQSSRLLTSALHRAQLTQRSES